jgi:hypothetical protein
MIPADLTERFHHSLVKKNPSGQDYVSIDGYINRLNEVLDHKWAWSINHWEFRDGPPTSKGKPQYLAIVSGTLTVLLDDIGVISLGDEGDGFLTTQRGLVSRDGIGAGLNFDPDTAAKTAQAEALKKACHQFGIALYLWSEDERDYVDLQRKAVNDDIQLKRLVMEYVSAHTDTPTGEQPTREDIVKILGTEDLSVENMRSILVEKGVL